MKKTNYNLSKSMTFIFIAIILNGCKSTNSDPQPPVIKEPEILITADTYNAEIKELQQKRYGLLAENLLLNNKMTSLGNIIESLNDKIVNRNQQLDLTNSEYSKSIESINSLKNREKKLITKLAYLEQQIELRSKALPSIPKKIICEISQDNYIIEKNSTTNRGNADGISVGYSGSYKNLKGVVAVNLNSIPNNAQIIKAELKYYCYFLRFNKNMEIAIFPESKEWCETESNWQTTPKGHSKKISSVTITEKNRWYSWDVTKQIQEWLNNKGTNSSFVLSAIDANAKSPNYASFNSKEAEIKPVLEIHFLEN